MPKRNLSWSNGPERKAHVLCVIGALAGHPFLHERYPIDRPDALNAINLQATQEFCDIVNRISSDQSVRAVVVTGTGGRLGQSRGASRGIDE